VRVGLGPGHTVIDGDPAPLPQRDIAPQFSAHICCSQMAQWIKMPLGRKVGLDPNDIVLDGDPAPLPKKGAESPIFCPCLLCTNGCMDQDATWYGGRPRPRPHCARCDPAPPPQKGGTVPQFLAHVCCSKMAGWIKMPLGMKVYLVPGHIVLHGDLAPPRKRSTAPIFGPCLLWPNGRPSHLLLSTTVIS